MNPVSIEVICLGDQLQSLNSDVTELASRFQEQTPDSQFLENQVSASFVFDSDTSAIDFQNGLNNIDGYNSGEIVIGLVERI